MIYGHDMQAMLVSVAVGDGGNNPRVICDLFDIKYWWMENNKSSQVRVGLAIHLRYASVIGSFKEMNQYMNHFFFFVKST